MRPGKGGQGGTPAVRDAGVMELRASYPAEAGSVGRARRALTEFAAAGGADLVVLDAIRLAASEAVANAVVHAYPDVPAEVHVAAWFTPKELWLLVSDDGCGLRGARPSSGLGMGLDMIARLADELVILERSTGGTELQMRFAIREDQPVRGSVASATSPACATFSTTR